MKYILLIYQAKDYNPTQLSQEEYKAVADGYASINALPNVTPGPPLGLPSEAMTVQSSGDKVTQTKGPYVKEAGGTVGGYYEIEADSEEEVVRLASRIPAIKQGGAVEIRPSRPYWQK